MELHRSGGTVLLAEEVCAIYVIPLVISVTIELAALLTKGNIVKAHGLAPDLVFLGGELDDLVVREGIGGLGMDFDVSATCSGGIAIVSSRRKALLILLLLLATGLLGPLHHDFAIRSLTLPVIFLPNFLI